MSLIKINLKMWISSNFKYLSFCLKYLYKINFDTANASRIQNVSTTWVPCNLDSGWEEVDISESVLQFIENELKPRKLNSFEDINPSISSDFYAMI